MSDLDGDWDRDEMREFGQPRAERPKQAGRQSIVE